MAGPTLILGVVAVAIAGMLALVLVVLELSPGVRLLLMQIVVSAAFVTLILGLRWLRRGRRGRS